MRKYFKRVVVELKDEHDRDMFRRFKAACYLENADIRTKMIDLMRFYLENQRAVV